MNLSSLGSTLGSVGSTVGSATTQLAQMMLNPQVIKGVLSLAGNVPGDTKVNIGGTDVPIGAIAQALSIFAGEAATEHYARTGGTAEEVPDYLFDSAGNSLVDPAVPEQRALALLQHVLQDNAMRAEEAWAEEDEEAWEEAWSEEDDEEFDDEEWEELDEDVY